MTHVHEIYHSSAPGMRTFCNLLFMILSAGAVVLLVLGIVCLASPTGSVGYCSAMTLGGFVSLTVTGCAIAVFCFVALCCLHCCIDSAERVALID